MIEDFTKRKENQRKKKKRNRKQRSPGEPERALKLHHRSNLSEKENEPQKSSEDFTMADKRKEKQTKKKKRKQRSPGESERPIKLHRRINSSEKENEPQWRNLELIISIDKRELDLHKKVKLVHGFVMSRVKEEDRFSDQDNEVVNISRLVTFINDWIESLLISEGKQVQSGGEEHQAQVIEMFLDLRCWEIFKFCLEESLKLNVSLNISRNLLRSICFIARNALSLLNKISSCPKDLFSIGEGLQLYNTVLDCVSLVFSSYEGFLNENLDLWLSLVGAVLDLVHKSYIKNIVSGDLGSFVFRFSCLVLKPFAMFLRARQPRKDEFHDFVYKLLEPLLHLLGLLHLHIHGSDPDPGWRRNLLKLVEEVLSDGLYHTKHIGGILELCPTEKYTTYNHGKSRDSKAIVGSYHRYLFDKLERILAAKNALAVESIGELFRLLVDQVKNVKKSSMLPEDTKVMSHTSKISSGSSIIEKSYCSTGVNTQARKSLHNFFVLIMEPLLLQINGYLETKLEVWPALLHVHSTLKSVNNVLSAFMHEKVYMRTEDTSEGACLNFLKKVYIIITSLSSNLIQLSKHGVVDSIYMGTLTSIASEVLSAVGYLLEIEYEVIENDLVSLWLMILSYLTIGSSLVDFPNGCSLSFKITDIGCQLITLYSQLRQVNSVIFALCKALRLLNLHNSDGEINYTRFVIPLNCKAYAQSVEKLLCAQEFKIAIQTAMKFMPEGQVTGCIRQLTLDVSECLEWMKISCSKADEKELSQWQAELLGRGLSEIYALVLQSLIVTPGNSILLGASIKDLITVICPCMRSLVGQQPDVNKFLCSVTGKGSYNEIAGNENISLIFGPSTYWVFVFFFQLYTSCRSLYREARILVPSELSRNMSTAMGDSFSGRDWMEMTEWINEGFFSWIIQPSASLLVVIESISLVHCKEPAADSCPLTYIMHTMACERLVDLKSRIKSFEYAIENSDNLVQVRSHDNDDGLSQCRKRSTEVLRQEAKGLTGFMMEHLSLVFKDQQLFFTSADTTYNSMIAYESDEWDFSVCAVNKKSLPTAIWWIVCQNIDTWCPHATQEYLEMFLSILFHTTLPGSSSGVVRQHKYPEADRLKKVTLHQISSQCFIDSILYEQRFVRSDYFASTFCHALEESTLPFISDISAGNVDLKSSPDWQKVLTALENSLVVVSCNKTNIFDCSSATKPANHASVLSESCKEQRALPSTIMKYTACQSLLSLLSRMPKGHLSSSSFTLYVTSILNLERIVVGGLLDYQNELYPNYYFELFSLFVSCRKSLKCVIMACDEKTVSNQTSETPPFFEDSFFVLWLYKSVYAVVGLQELFSKDNSCSVDDMIFSLMDHTFYVFLTSNKYEPNHGELNAGFVHGQKYSMESDPCLDSSNSIQAWKSVTVVAKSLKEQMQNLLVNLKDGLCNGKVRIGVDILSLNKFSSITSCFSGFLWGLARVIHTDGRNRDHKANLSRWKLEPWSELNRCIDVFAQFSSLLLQMVFFDNNQQSRTLNDAQNLQRLVDNVDAEEFLPEDNGADTDISCGGMQDKSAPAMTCTTLSDIQDDSITDRVHRKRVHLKDANYFVRDLTAVDSFELQSLNKPLLRSLLNGDYPDTAFLLRQLLIAASAVLRLNSHINIAPLSSSLVHKFTSITQVLLLESVDMSQVPHFCHFVCLDGVLKYLEELAYHFPLTDPTFSTNFYVKIVQLQLRAIGKCITLQGKRATLASHESQSSTKMLHSPMGVSEASLSGWQYLQDEFKARLRSSFAVFIKKSTEPLLLSVVTAIKKALDGVQEGLTVSYVPADRGKVSSTVAAGIDCLDLLLEFVSGRNCLGVVKRHIQSFLARMFDVILHLQSPLIFYDGFTQSKGDSYPDPGAVILMCVDVLARITGKAVYKMKPWHLARCLLIPSSLFQDFHLLRPSESPSPNDSSNIPNNQVSDPVASIHFSGIDRQYSLDLFAACCRLLHNVLKHHKSECQRCIYLLQASVCVLLHCLETLDVAVAMEGFFSWEVEEGIKCACSLRRIFEELRHQKDVFGPYCFQFLSDYIFVYSGYGPRKTGIKREIDEALRPGVYALIDVCSVDDLQRLHTWFGEGPCRNTLATLKHDYEFNFKYQGKV